MSKVEGRCCFSCGNYMGGGACKINLELECAAGGGYEAWEPMRKFAFADMAKDYVRYIGHKGGYSIHKVKGHFELTLEGDTYGRKEN